ncbi:amidohydrolase family protein [Paenibacillus septentrionalis]|uniref:Amidohydrolase family protein n=1 Tax=Paenibacillus septentrionalis TaxID=429342 RepID=A0ABW1V4X5_9BACL
MKVSNKAWAMSGFSNEHAHLDKGVLVPGVSYEDAPAPVRGEWTRGLKAQFTKEDIYARAEQALLNMLSYGTTYVRTHVDVDPLVGLKGIEAILELKQNYAKDIIIDITAFNQEGFERFPETEHLLAEALKMGRVGIGGHTLTDPDGVKHIQRVFDLAEKFDAPWIEFHTDESGKPEHFLLPNIAEETKQRGLRGKVYAIHCNSLANVSDEQAKAAIEQVVEAGLHVIVCPTAIATRAITRTKELLKSGVRITLGSDNMGDLFNPLGSGNMLNYAQMLTYIQRFYEPNEMQFILEMITQKPLDDQASVALEQLSVQVVYETDRIHELLAHAPKPLAILPQPER